MRTAFASCGAVLAISRIETTLSIPLTLFRLLTSDQAEWRGPDGAVQRGPLADLVGHAAGAQLLLIAPGEAVTLHRVPLPSQKRSTWARAVPYALEDQVAEDLETLHFAFSALADGAYLPVAVVAHDALRGWLNRCDQAGIAPVAVIPEPLLLPWRDGDWSVWLEPHRAVVRTGRWEGFAAERDLLELLLNQALVEASDAKPQRLRVWGGSPPTLAEADWELHREEGPTEPLQWLATVYQPTQVINLLQGVYSRQAHWGRWLRPWKAAAALAGVWLLIQGIAQVHEHWSLQRELATLRAEIEQAFKDAVPSATRIVNPRVQLETRLRELRPASTSSGAFLELLSHGGQPLAGFPAVTLRGFSYRDGQLDLDLQGGDPAVLDQLRQQLNQQTGVQAEVRTTQREGQIDSKVTLKRARS